MNFMLKRRIFYDESALVSDPDSLQNNVNALHKEKEFYEPETASSSGMSLVPSQPTPRFSRNLDAWNSTRRTGGTYSQNCTMETPRYAISEMSFGKFPDPDDFQCWRVSFQTEVCVSTSTPELTTSWINEVEMTSQSIEGGSFS